jgi:cbb3-type cytochrome c oxidase subunit III
MKKTIICQLSASLAIGMLISFNALADFSKSFEGYGLYTKHCVICHGSDGTGNGLLAGRLETKPADLTDPSLAKKRDHEIFQIIEGTAPHGRVSENMPQWGHALPQNHIDSLVYYIRYLNRTKYPTSGNPVGGKQVYDAYCTDCHGKDGKGGGTLAMVYNMKPADHTNSMEMNKMDNQELKDYIKTGDDTTLMPGWKGVLTDKEIDDVVSYIRLLSANEDE